jgi:hypothetical protein
MKNMSHRAVRSGLTGSIALAIALFTFGTSVAIGAGGTGGQPAAATTTTPAWSYPGGCSQAQIAYLVDHLIAAFNAGNATAVGRLIAPKPAFQWFAVSGGGARFGDRSKDRATIAAWVRDRHRHHARWLNPKIQGNLGVNLTIKSDDHATIRVIGKGEINCRGVRPLLTVWAT